CWAIYKKGTYGDFLGRGVDDLKEALFLIDELHKVGVDYIKIINSGIFMPKSGKISRGGFDKKELKEMVSYAKHRNLEVYCHANGDERIGDAVEAGVSCIIHGFYISEDTLRLMHEKHVCFIPTVYALLSLSEMGDKNIVKDMVERHLSAIKRSSEIGVTIKAGSDAGSFIPYGSSYISELELLKKAGLTYEEVLHTAISKPFRQGESADFLLLDGFKVKKIFLRNREVPI
ncbi:MAG: hypothetical protein D6828_02140, partial [Nitrospirae bacterium]